MVEIKYRAWDSLNKQFVYFELFKGVNKHTPPIYPEAQLEEWEMFIKLPNHPHLLGVYEGDIIQYRENTGDIVMQCVKWSDALVGFNLVSNNNDYMLMGNIHETPKLIEKKEMANANTN